jgi:CBS domain-containing protein
MKVADLMTRGAHTCRAGESLADAARIMWEHDCGFVPVVDDNGSGRLVGAITDRDICMAAYTQGRPLEQIPLGTAMSRHVHRCAPGDRLASAEAAMRSHKVRRLPVVENERVVGVISLSDLARAAARRGRERVSDMEVGETLAAISEPRQLAAQPGAA